MGIPSLADMNLSLLASWIKRYQLDDNKLWKQIIDHKYNVNSPNIFASSSMGVSPFWKGVLWAAQAAKIGYRWKVGNGRKIKFWEDQWFGTSSLAIQYWDIYVIANEKSAVIADIWDGEKLRVTFRRCFNHELLIKWYGILQIAQSIHLSGEEDAMVWKLENSGFYSVSSLYAVINFRGVLPVYTHAVWKVKVPPKIHFFLRLISHNKILTRDNLGKRQFVDDPTCALCAGPKTCCHIFFECVVAKAMWATSEHGVNQANGNVSFESIGSLWLSEKKNSVHNTTNAAVFWIIWNTRNDHIFNRKIWPGLQVMWRKVATMLSQWTILFSGDAEKELSRVAGLMEQLAQKPLPLLWPDPG
uniref:Uncharacterized protein n=1 Tax=Avena sativa TaxID=4498 RepID=A0ACD6AF76_AVESA